MPLTLESSNISRIAIMINTLIVTSLTLSGITLANSDLPPSLGNNLAPSENTKDTSDICGSCRLLVKSFEKGMDKTMRGKHEGGDTSWEEKNLKNYTDSEIRLIEIQEDLCNDVTEGKPQCLSLAEDSEEYIEDWWFKHRKNNIRLHDYLCIQKLKKCCPENSFGPNCQTCSSDCNGHGICDGSGTRTGSGECICNTGYSGDHCAECSENYFKMSTTEMALFTCLACHEACKGGCNGPNSANCTECLPGYKRDETKNCVDINECDSEPNEFDAESNRLCPKGTYCLNTNGHYRCAMCHRACSTCVGPGRDQCLSCAPEYSMDDDHNCVHKQDYSRKIFQEQSEWRECIVLDTLRVGAYFLFREIISRFFNIEDNRWLIFLAHFSALLIFPGMFPGICAAIRSLQSLWGEQNFAKDPMNEGQIE